MRIYTVHQRPAPPGAEPDVVLVKEGFSWPAFWAPPLWLVWHRQWLGLAVYLAGLAVVALLAGQMNVYGESAIGLCYSVLIGASANDWRRTRLGARGYDLQQVIAAGSLDEAESRYFRTRAGVVASVPRPAPAKTMPAYRRQESAAPLAPWSP